MNITEKEIKNSIKSSLKLFKENDFILLDINVNERTIVHKIACYLQSEFNEWDVDVEYNRDQNNTKRISDSSIIPDIVIHKRTTNNNLLAIEIKKNEISEWDLNKLKKIKSEFNYRYILYINLNLDGSEFQCLYEDDFKKYLTKQS